MPFCNADAISYFIEKARDCASTNPFESRAWLLTGSSIAPNIFQIQLEAYALEKRLGNAEGAAIHFVTLFRKFMNCLDEEIAELGNAVRNHHINKGKETPEQLFLLEIFAALPKEIQMEVLMQRSEHSTVIYEKCQFMLLLVKLYPDTVGKSIGADLLYNILGCESDVYSTFRSLLVNELVPAVLQLSKNLAPSKHLITLLDQCIEYYTLVLDPQLAGRSEDFLEITAKRWDELFKIVDQIGVAQGWKISPFFSISVQNASGTVESMYHSLSLAFQHKSHYSTNELAYISIVLFLRCLVTADQLASYTLSNFGGPSKLTLVQIFYPQAVQANFPDTSGAPIVTTVSHSSALSSIQSTINSYFITAVKLWQLISKNGSIRGNRIEKEIRLILLSMKSLQLETWPIFQNFLVDFRLYTEQYTAADIPAIDNPLKLASLFCSMKNYKEAARAALKAIENLGGNFCENAETMNVGGMLGDSEDLSFFNYMHGQDNLDYSTLKRFHFISEDRHEVLFYVANILIRCLHEALNSPHHDDLCAGHLLTLLQLEWPSPAAVLVLNNVIEDIRKRGHFSYFPYFGNFIIEPDYLETFMGIANREAKTIILELFTAGTFSSGSSSRRISTRGADKGVKNDFRQSMKRQMMKKYGSSTVENLVYKFLSTHSSEITSVFE